MMNSASNVKKLCICAICVAFCCVLPMAFHAVGLGSILSPMHIPVLLCGLVCGGGWGAVCGVLGPVLSSLFGMPPMMMLFRMVPELCVYGLAGGLAMRLIRTGRTAADVYISLVIAMLLGRVAGGIASVIFYAVTTGAYSFAMFAASYFVESLPGIAAHLITVPALYLVLVKTRAIPARYVGAAGRG